MPDAPGRSAEVWHLSINLGAAAAPEFDGQGARLLWAESETVLAIQPACGPVRAIDCSGMSNIALLPLPAYHPFPEQTIKAPDFGALMREHPRVVVLPAGTQLTPVGIENALALPAGSIGAFPATISTDPRTAAEARQALLASERPLRFRALRALGRWGDSTAILSAMKDSDLQIRAWACVCARLCPSSPELLSALAGQLLDVDLAMKAAAWSSLEHLTGQTDIRSVEEWQVYRQDKSSVVPALEQSLISGDASRRYGAARALGESGRLDAIPAMLKEHASRDAALDPVRSLDGEYLNAMWNLIGFPDLSRKNLGWLDRFWWRLLAMRERPVDEIAGALSSEDPDVRLAAIVALGRRKGDRAQQLLAGHAEKQAYPSEVLEIVRRRRATGACLLDDEPAPNQVTCERLFELWKTTLNPWYEDALMKRGAEGYPWLVSGFGIFGLRPQDLTDRYHRDEALARRLATVGEAVVPALVDGTSSPDPRVRYRSVWTLGVMHLPPAVAPAVRMSLHDEHRGVREEAASLLQWSCFDAQAEDMAEPLLKALVGGDDAVRAHAARAMRLAFQRRREPQRKQAAAALIKALADPSAEVRRESAEALGWLKADEAVAALLRTLDDPADEVARMALATLSRIRTEEVRSTMLRLLSSDRPTLRAGAVYALARFGDAESMTAIAKLAQDPSPEVRRAVTDVQRRTSSRPS